MNLDNMSKKELKKLIQTYNSYIDEFDYSGQGTRPLNVNDFYESEYQHYLDKPITMKDIESQKDDLFIVYKTDSYQTPESKENISYCSNIDFAHEFVANLKRDSDFKYAISKTELDSEIVNESLLEVYDGLDGLEWKSPLSNIDYNKFPEKKFNLTHNFLDINTPFTVAQYDKKLREKYPELTKEQSSSVAFCAVNGHLPIEIASNNVLVDNIDKNKLMSVKKDGEIEDVVLKDNLLSVQNENGNKFNARLLTKGDKYGLDNCLTYDKNMPLVEFYDDEYKHTDLGQFVSRYNADTLLGEDGITKESHRGKLCLDLAVPEWTINSEQMNKVIDWLEKHPIVQDAIQQKKFNKLIDEANQKNIKNNEKLK